MAAAALVAAWLAVPAERRSLEEVNAFPDVLEPLREDREG
jgi:hypothetical protein